MTDLLTQLANIIDERKKTSPEKSYVASLHQKGLDTILKKIGEEATETVIAAKNKDKAAIIYESADLWFHHLIMLRYFDITPDDILNELQRRLGISGLDEKAARKLNEQHD